MWLYAGEPHSEEIRPYALGSVMIAAASKQPRGKKKCGEENTKLWQKVNVFIILFCQFFCMLKRFAREVEK